MFLFTGIKIYKKMRVICTICARGGSKGLKNKNLIKLNGNSLTRISIKQAIKSNLFDEIVLSSDSNKILFEAKKYKFLNLIKREKKLSNDTVGKILAIRDAVLKIEKKKNFKFDVIVDLDVTCPLRLISDIKNAYNIFKKKNSDNLLTVTSPRKNPYFNILELKNGKLKKLKKSKKKITSRQMAPVVYEMNAAIYIWKRKSLFSESPFLKKKTSLYKMPYERSIDIDSALDLKNGKIF